MRVTFPFAATSEQPFWVLYQPALLSINGWFDVPEDIPRCCLVEATLIDVIEQGVAQYEKDYAWINVRVEQVILLHEIVQQLPAKSSGEACPTIQMVQKSSSYSYHKIIQEEWTLIDVNVEGDVGGWIVVQDYNDSKIIVLYYDWWGGVDNLYAGHRPLTEEEWRQLNDAGNDAGSDAN